MVSLKDIPTEELVKNVVCSVLTADEEKAKELINRGNEAVPYLSKYVREKKYQSGNVESENVDFYAPISAMYIMAAIKNPDSLEDIIYAIYNYYTELEDHIIEDVSDLLGEFGQQALKRLYECASDKNLHIYSRAACATAISIIGSSDENYKTDAIRYLRSLIENEKENKDFASFAMYDLVNLKDENSFAFIKNIFSEGKIKEEILDYKTVLDLYDGLVKTEIEEHYFEPLEYFSESELEEKRVAVARSLGLVANSIRTDEIDFDNFEKIIEKRTGINDPCICGSGNKYKKCCKELQDKRSAIVETEEWLNYFLADIIKRKGVVGKDFDRFIKDLTNEEEITNLDVETELLFEWFLHDNDYYDIWINQFFERRAMKEEQKSAGKLWHDSRMRIVKIAGIKRNVGFDVVDLIDDSKYFVWDANASNNLLENETVIARPYKINDVTRIAGYLYTLPKGTIDKTVSMLKESENAEAYKKNTLEIILLLKSKIDEILSSKKDNSNGISINEKLGRLVDVELRYDSSDLNDNQIRLLRKMVKVSKLIDSIFLKQVYSKNFEIMEKLEGSDGEKEKLELKYFMWNKGPWDKLDNEEPFIGKEKRREGVEFYPEDMTRKEFEEWLEKHPEDEESFKSPFTVIRRKDRRLVAVPYSVEYKEFIEPAANLMKEAALLADNESLKAFLNKKAEAFLSNNYFESEVAWMDLDSDIEITIGPYEVYDDALFGYKASFESFVTIKDREESEKLKVFAKYLEEIDRILPIDPKYSFTKKSQKSPIAVVNEIFAGGEANSGYRAMAFNLPNDEKVRAKKGSKKVLLKNIMESKFEKLAVPLAERIISGKQLKYLNFEAYFRFVLFHELSHGLGPSFINKNGKDIPVNEPLKDLYNSIEEAKADIAGLYSAFYFFDNGVLPKDSEIEFYIAYLVGIFRSLRFGLKEAHAKGSCISYNYLKERGAIFCDEFGEFEVIPGKMRDSVTELLKEFLVLQLEGDYQLAKNFMDKYLIIDKELKNAIDTTSDLPIDINPIFIFEL
jgi:hypothetical protein